MSKFNPDKIPSHACTLGGGEMSFGDNGDGAKSQPVTLRARSSEPIAHWFWGKVVHDFAGMKMAKDRIPIDYCHDSKDIVGYANRHEIDENGLTLSGALVPFKDSDRASEIVHKTNSGVPYEASIFFGGDGIKVEHVNAGITAFANGREYQGPITIVREWPLRGVAVCPYGADAHTSSMFSNGETLAVEVVEPKEETSQMATEEKTKIESEAVEAIEAEGVPVEQPVEATELEAEATEPEAQPEPETEPEPERSYTKTEVSELVDKFGADIAAKVMAQGGGMAEGYELKLASDAERIRELEASVSKFAATSGGQPVGRNEATGKKRIPWG
jgi:hypothetical protein